MSSRNEGNNGDQTVRSSNRRRLILTGIGFLAIIGLLWATGLLWYRPSADERLAQIEAARAIPDSENAAMVYDRLLQDSNAISLLSNLPESLEPSMIDRGQEEQWLAGDHPELGAWVTEHQYVIDRLLEATRFEKCRFPISIDLTDTSAMERTTPMRQWAFLLCIAANNDLAEGRVDAALTKWECILRVAEHLQQQPDWTACLTAAGIQRLALQRIARFIVVDNPREMDLGRIESTSLPIFDMVSKRIDEAREIERLTMQKMKEGWGLLDHLQGWWFQRRVNRINRMMHGTAQGTDFVEEARYQYARSMAAARGTRILVAMKRYKGATGHWPTTLDELKASLPDEILTDPLNQGAFVYKPVEGTFTLYSRGKNNIDENGEYDADASESGVQDDWPIWPLPAPKPRPSDEEIEQQLREIYGNDYEEMFPEDDGNDPQ